jgi:hypothetical protein
MTDLYKPFSSRSLWTKMSLRIVLSDACGDTPNFKISSRAFHRPKYRESLPMMSRQELPHGWLVSRKGCRYRSFRQPTTTPHYVLARIGRLPYAWVSRAGLHTRDGSRQWQNRPSPVASSRTSQSSGPAQLQPCASHKRKENAEAEPQGLAAHHARQ